MGGNMNRVAIGSSHVHDYSFYIPLTVLFWRRINYEPIVLLNYSEGEWISKSHSGVALEALRWIGADIHFVGTVEGLSEATMAQCSRVHAACLDIAEDTILSLADADLWPFRKEFYHQHDPARWDITLLYANGYN